MDNTPQSRAMEYRFHVHFNLDVIPSSSSFFLMKPNALHIPLYDQTKPLII